MDRRAFIITLTGSFLAAPLASEAQPGKVHRIGYLSSGPSTSNLYRGAFQQNLRELGWVEGQNIITDYDLRRVGWIGYPTSRPSSSGSRWTLS